MNLEDPPARGIAPPHHATHSAKDQHPRCREGGEPSGEATETFPPDAELAATAEEERAVEEAARATVSAEPSPPSRSAPDHVFLYSAVLLALLLLFGWIGGTTIWQLRRDLRELDARLAALQARTQAGEHAQAQAALLRAQAELQALRQTLPDPLAEQVEEARRLLEGLSSRVSASP